MRDFATLRYADAIHIDISLLSPLLMPHDADAITLRRRAITRYDGHTLY